METPTPAGRGRSSWLYVALALTLFIMLIVGATAASARQAGDGLVWTAVDEAQLAPAGRRLVVPQTYLTCAADLAALTATIDSAPLEFTAEAQSVETVLTLPLPDGSFGRFRIFESPVMAAELAAKFPEIRTFTAKGIDDVHASGRIDLTPAGFHAMIFGSTGTFFIDPYSQGDASAYIVYDKESYVSDQPYDEIEPIPGSPDISELVAELQAAGKLTVGEELRTYRLALATTGEYSIYHGGTVPLVMAELVTAVNRVTGIYEREVAVRMELIPNNDVLIYLDPDTDPYTNDNGSAMLGQNQTTLDTVIGTANYDIGHVFSTGGGGIAGLRVVCVPGSKARGVTGLTNPIGDPFYVDYVAHEMGHQYGGNHTFNGNEGSCLGNIAIGHNFEPGSGTTIMAYAGICGSQDIQEHSDDYFHGHSQDEIIAFTTTGLGSLCPAVTDTGNTPPTPDAGPGGYTLPVETPFELVGSGDDADGDPITYNWEEFDFGVPGHPDNPVGNAALFRSFPAVDEPSRTFPQFSDLVNGVHTIGELLPTYERPLNFRLTVRDNHVYPSAGGVAYDTITMTVTEEAGPFLVLEPNTPVTWTGYALESVTWDVANTDQTPVSCDAVNIRLSLDGGYTYPVMIAAGVANDGSEPIEVPNQPTTTARIRVECAGNVFFDISDEDFTIEAGVPVAPTAGFTSTSPDQLGEITVFTNTSTGTGLSFVWDFGDGSPTSTEANPSHEYLAAGTYTVTLTATNSLGSDIFEGLVEILGDEWTLHLPLVIGG